MKTATLGPKGTFSHEAALKFNPKAKIIFTETIREIFELVGKKKADFGIVPVENSIAGSIGQTLDYLNKFNVKIHAEEVLQINHNLAGFGPISDIKTLYVHPQTKEQCSEFIIRNFRNAEIVQTSSNSKSAELVSNAKHKSKGAIIPLMSSKIYGLKIIKTNVQDNKFNFTRFFILGKADSEKAKNPKTGILVRPSNDMPGLLYGLLGEFAKRKINLTKIESRPAKGKLGDYVFYIDFAGHRKEKRIGDLLDAIAKNFHVKVFGSYQRKY